MVAQVTLPTPGCQGGSGGVSTFSTVTSPVEAEEDHKTLLLLVLVLMVALVVVRFYWWIFWRNGNTLCTTPQGNPGGNNTTPGGSQASSGGGGAGAAANPVPQCAAPQRGSAGGAGISTSITGSSVARSGGGGSNMSDDTGNPGELVEVELVDLTEQLTLVAAVEEVKTLLMLRVVVMADQVW